jgi:hypothetical protein
VGAFNKMLAKTLEKADEKAVLQKSDEKKDDSEGEQSKKRAMEKFFQLVGNLPKMVEVQNAEGGGAQPPATTVKSKFILEKDENEETKKKKKEEEIKGKAAGKGQQDTSGNEKTETNKVCIKN